PGTAGGVNGQAGGGGEASGGGVTFGLGSLTIQDSTISDNTARAGGGYFAANADGGGLENRRTGSLTLQNCTVSHNTAAATGGGVALGGGLYDPLGTATLIGVLFLDNSPP